MSRRPFDNTQAQSEGWAVFNEGEIQRLDEEAKFASDEEAIAFVTKLANAGSAYHLKALLCCANAELFALADAVRDLKAFGGSGGTDAEEKVVELLDQVALKEEST